MNELGWIERTLFQMASIGKAISCQKVQKGHFVMTKTVWIIWELINTTTILDQDENGHQNSNRIQAIGND